MVLDPNPEVVESPRAVLGTRNAIASSIAPPSSLLLSAATVDPTGNNFCFFSRSGNSTLVVSRKRRLRPNPQQQHRSSGHSRPGGYYFFWTCAVMILSWRRAPGEVRAFVPSGTIWSATAGRRTPAAPHPTQHTRQRLSISTATATSDHRIVPVRVGNSSSDNNNNNNNIQRNHHQRPSSSVASSASSTSPSTLQLLSSAVELCHVDWTPPSSSSTTQCRRPAALFLHGLLGNKRNFATIARSLGPQLDQPRRILGLDLRNHGDNHHDWRDEMSYTAMAHDVLSFCNRHQLEQVELIGHSVGGKVAQALALLAPERVSGLVVLDIAPVTYTTDEPHWKAVHEIVQALRAVPLHNDDDDNGGGSTLRTKRQVDAQLRHTIPDPALRAFCLTNLDETTGQWKIHLEGIAQQLEALARFDVEPAALQQPYHGDAFFIHGGQSRFVRHAHLETIGTHFPNHLLTTIRGAGHWVHAEAPEDTTALLKRFLDRK